jgi:WD40 repeat protein
MRFVAPPPPATIDPVQTHPVAEFKHTSPLIGCRFDPTGEYVFAGSQDNAVVRWHPASKKVILLNGHKSWVRALAFAGREKLLFSADWAGRLLAWPVAVDAPAPTWNIQAHRGWVRALAVSPDGKTLASCGNDHLVKFWSIPEGKLLREFAGHESHVYNLAFHPDGRSLVSGDLHGIVKVWDLEKGTAVREMDAKVLHKYDAGFGADIGGVRSMAFSPDGNLLACAGITNVSNAFAGIGNPLVILFDWATGKQKQLLRPKINFQGTAWGVIVHERGFVLAAGAGNGGALWAWKPNEALAYHTLTLPNNARDLALHPVGRRLAVPFFDGFLRLYDMGPK